MPDDSMVSRRAVLGAAAAIAVAGCASDSGVEQTPLRTPAGAFDAWYAPGFQLPPLSAVPVLELPRPQRATSLADALIDPAHGTRLYRATAVAEGRGRYLRHEYARRQAFNADCSRYLAQDETGHWHLYDGATFAHLGSVAPLAGDCEPLWHARESELMYFTDRGGSLRWQLLDVGSGVARVVADATGQLPWPQTTALWTRGEGTTSADSRYVGLIASSDNSGSGTSTCHGLVTLDLATGTVTATLAAAEFPTPEAMPDHLSMSPSGDFVVVSWLAEDGGTVAYTRGLTQPRQLFHGSEHSDLAIGADGQDLMVVADYQAGQIAMIDVATGQRTDLHSLYPASGEAYAVHISGQAFDRPGWAVISTYADNADYGATAPAPVLRAEYRKVWLQELVPGGRALGVAHVRGSSADLPVDPYFLEPHATASRDLSRICFASNFGGGEINTYVVGLPSWALV